MDALHLEPLSDAKRRLLERLKRVDTATAPDLAKEFGLTDTAVRQHLETLERLGLVARAVSPPVGRGRPPVRWRLADTASSLFPDRHGEFSRELLEAVRDTFGDEGVTSVIASRASRQQAAYGATIGTPADTPLEVRVRRLAELRSAEGYVAEATRRDHHWELVEHHCPVGDAASACRHLCHSELDLFRAVLGPDVEVERISHVLSGDSRCAYRIAPATGSSQH